MKKISVDKEVKAVLFDCDGTLVDSMPLHMHAWENALKQFNTPYEENYLFSLKGMKETDIVILYNKKFGFSLNPEKVVSVKQNYIQLHINEVKPIARVVEIAEKYSGILPMAVVSGSSRDIVLGELNTIGITGLFDAILTADDPYKPKPSPEIFYAAASLLHIDPRNCLVLEDGDPGLKAAADAGMKTIDVRDYL